MPPSHRKDAYVSDDRVISARLHFLTSRKAPASAMAPRNRDDNFMDVDSDSDISLLGDAEHRGKGKGKSKATDKRKKDKGKAKAKEVSKAVFITELYSYFLQQAYTWEASYTRSWDTVQEDEAGSLQGAVEDLMARGRRRRSIHFTSPIVFSLT